MVVWPTFDYLMSATLHGDDAVRYLEATLERWGTRGWNLIPFGTVLLGGRTYYETGDHNHILLPFPRMDAEP